MSGLTKLFQKALRGVEKLSPEEQDRIANFVIEDVEYSLDEEGSERELCEWLDDLEGAWESPLTSPLDRDPFASWD